MLLWRKVIIIGVSRVRKWYPRVFASALQRPLSKMRTTRDAPSGRAVHLYKTIVLLNKWKQGGRLESKANRASQAQRLQPPSLSALQLQYPSSGCLPRSRRHCCQLLPRTCCRRQNPLIAGCRRETGFNVNVTIFPFFCTKASDTERIAIDSLPSPMYCHHLLSILKYRSVPSVLIATPPASVTISCAAQKSHTCKPMCQKASQKPCATWQMSRAADPIARNLSCLHSQTYVECHNYMHRW